MITEIFTQSLVLTLDVMILLGIVALSLSVTDYARKILHSAGVDAIELIQRWQQVNIDFDRQRIKLEIQEKYAIEQIQANRQASK